MWIESREKREKKKCSQGIRRVGLEMTKRQK